MFVAAVDMVWLENIEVKNTGGTTKHGFYWSTGTSEGFFILNCCANNCSGDGFNINTNSLGYTTFFRCVSYSNTGAGFQIGAAQYGGEFMFCAARENINSPPIS